MLPSVTSILEITKPNSDKEQLAKWVAKVGEAESKRIASESSSRGTAIHSRIENFLKGKLNGDLLEDGILEKNSSNNLTCLAYKPYLGKVQDMESLDIKSDKFEITEQNALILNGNVEIDFPDGILISEKARVDQDNGFVDFVMNSIALVKLFLL